LGSLAHVWVAQTTSFQYRPSAAGGRTWASEICRKGPTAFVRNSASAQA
jgi:hypothetical protein